MKIIMKVWQGNNKPYDLQSTQIKPRRIYMEYRERKEKEWDANLKMCEYQEKYGSQNNVTNIKGEIKMARDYSECTEKTGMGWSMKNILRNCERHRNNEDDAEGDPGKQRGTQASNGREHF
jgi:hypothetical protein